MGVRPDESTSRYIQRGFVTLEHELKDNDKLSRAVLKRIDNMQAALAKVAPAMDDFDFETEFNLPIQCHLDFNFLNDGLSNKKTRTQFVSLTFVGLFFGGSLCLRKSRCVLYSVLLFTGPFPFSYWRQQSGSCCKKHYGPRRAKGIWEEV